MGLHAGYLFCLMQSLIKKEFGLRGWRLDSLIDGEGIQDAATIFNYVVRSYFQDVVLSGCLFLNLAVCVPPQDVRGSFCCCR